MDFRTEVVVGTLPSEWRLSYAKRLMLLGSCFSDSIGERFLDAGFRAEVNPFGTLYNPVSIALSLRRLMSGTGFSAEELFLDGGLWHSFAHHSRFSAVDRDSGLSHINECFRRAAEALRSCEFLFLTFGSAWVYKSVETGQVVSNCHKLPSSAFVRERLDVQSISNDYLLLLDELHRINPDLKVIFSVSPIRHLRDGAHQNQLSKATLLLALDEICRQRNEARYFPAYEIVLDELRDYRFFAADMAHPSEMATAYVWEKLSNLFFDGETMKLAQQVEKLRKALRHKPFHAKTDAYRRFLETTREQLSFLRETYGIELEEWT